MRDYELRMLRSAPDLTEREQALLDLVGERDREIGELKAEISRLQDDIDEYERWVVVDDEDDEDDYEDEREDWGAYLDE